MNVLRQIKKVIYRLKRSHGVTVLFKNRAATINRETGVETPTFTNKTVKRVIIMPEAFQRNFVYDSSYLVANRNFSTGGFFDAGNRVLIVDNKDLGTFVVDNDTHYEINDKYYDTVEIISVAEGLAHAIKIRHIKGRDDE